MTKLVDIIDPADLNRGIGDGFIRVQRHPEVHGLNIYSYTDKAMVTSGAWDNPAVRQCRGLIVDAEGEVLARPWAKFFNYNQPEAAVIALDEGVEVLDKLDGSLGILYWLEGMPHIATRGSFTSDQALWATRWIQDHHRMFPLVRERWHTSLFEIIYRENRIVLDYGDFEGLVLLGSVGIRNGRTFDVRASADGINWLGRRAAIQPARTLAEALAVPPRPNAEGLVVTAHGSPQRMVKIKQEDYIALHKIVTGLSERGVWERLMAGDTREDILSSIPDEFHQWAGDVIDELQGAALDLVREVNQVFQSIREHYDNGDRKAFAIEAIKHARLRPFLFMAFDEATYEELERAALKTLKPEGDTRVWNKKEAA